MYPKGTSFRAPAVKFFACLISTKIPHFWTDTKLKSEKIISIVDAPANFFGVIKIEYIFINQ